MNKMVAIRGTREGLTIALGSSAMPEILQELARHLQAQGAFFRGGMVALEVGERPVSADDLAAIQKLLGEYDMTLRTVLAADKASQEAALALGLRLVSPAAPEAEAAPPAAPTALAAGSAPFEGVRGILVRRRIRSGQVVRHTGHIVVIGDVHAGAEIVAGGDIVVWGRLFGTAHAGAAGDENAIVCALELAPLQLRIGHVVARPAEGERQRPQYPEVAYVRDGLIVIDKWDRTPRGV